MQRLIDTTELPDFIVRSTFGVAFVAALLLAPFGVNNLLQDRLLLGILTLFISVLCVISCWQCTKGKYNIWISLFGIAPSISITIILATYEIGVKGSYWAFLVVLGLYVILPKWWAVLFSALFIGTIVPVAFLVIEPSVAIRFAAVLLGTGLFAFVTMSEITKQHNMIKEKARTDPLTGLLNRSILKQTLAQAIDDKRAENKTSVLIMLDIDDFKYVNDVHGHSKGDEVLKALAKLLKASFPDEAKIFRIGGEEFLVFVAGMAKPGAFTTVEQVRLDMEAKELVPNKQITISVGLLEVQPELEWSDWMKQCDDKLYFAKSNGRNQVAV